MFKSHRIRGGLVFAVPLGNGQYGFGQLVERRGSTWFMVGFGIVKPDPALECGELEKGAPAFGGDFVDDELRKGDWLPVGYCSPPPPRLKPCSKVMNGKGEWIVASWDQKRWRYANEEEVRSLPYEDIFSAAVFTESLGYYAGLRAEAPLFLPLSWSKIVKYSQLLDNT